MNPTTGNTTVKEAGELLFQCAKQATKPRLVCPVCKTELKKNPNKDDYAHYNYFCVTCQRYSTKGVSL